jgi:signal transduction histidine kinase
VEILVSNLVENAIRHNLPGGHINVAVSTRQAQAALTVSNTGPHVPAGQVERLLQPFQHLDGARSHENEGLGLGLSIIGAIASAHDAILSVRPRPAGGLTIEVGFRAADAVASSPITKTQRASAIEALEGLA